MDLGKIKYVGIAAAQKAGDILISYYGNLKEIKKKGAIDLVTAADLASEKAIIDLIRRYFPDHEILAEESGLNSGHSNYQWIIDPLDGTTNFAHQLVFFAVSIAFAVKGDIVFGIVFNPVTRELFMGVKDEGAMLNSRPITVSKVNAVSDSLLVTGFPYNLHEMLPTLTTRLSNCLNASQGVRRLGAAAIDLCYVACGRLEGFWEQNLKPWDTAAGKIILTEAGGKITNFSNEPFQVDMKEVLATNGFIHDKMLSLLDLKGAL